jgi:hypothetical protein
MIAEYMNKVAEGARITVGCLVLTYICCQQFSWGATRLRCRLADAEHGTEADGAGYGRGIE